jgi:hypothetical protein
VGDRGANVRALRKVHLALLAVMLFYYFGINFVVRYLPFPESGAIGWMDGWFVALRWTMTVSRGADSNWYFVRVPYYSSPSRRYSTYLLSTYYRSRTNEFD